VNNEEISKNKNSMRYPATPSSVVDHKMLKNTKYSNGGNNNVI